MDIEQNDLVDNEYGCTLYIDTELEHPDALSRKLGIEASKITVKGENKIHYRTKNIIEGKYNEYNLWILKIEGRKYPKGIYLENPIIELLNLMDERKDVFLEVLQNYPKRHILSFAYFYDYNPYFLFDHNLIKRLSAYQIDIEFDLYFLPSNNEKES